MLETPVAGMVYHDANRLLSPLAPGQVLTLRRQPGNPYDNLAIEVLVPEAGKLGYIPRIHSQPLARLMDSGKILHAQVLQLSTGTWEKLWLNVWMVG